MKKIFLLLLLFITYISNSYAQNRNIVIDQTNNNERFIETQCVKIGNLANTKTLNIALQLIIKQNDTTFCLVTNINSLTNIKTLDEAISLFKLSNGEIVELKSLKIPNSSEKQKNQITSTFNKQSLNTDKNINYWNIKPNIIQKFKKGISKIKIQYKNDIYEKSFKKDKIGYIIYDSYLSLINYIKNYPDKNDKFRENF